MRTTTEGSCLCGAVTYEAVGALRPVWACHCTQCRKTSGHHVAATQCLSRDLTIRGDALKWFRSSETAERGFCGLCGSNLFWRPISADRVSILAGTINGPTGLSIIRQIHVEDAGDYYDVQCLALTGSAKTS